MKKNITVYFLSFLLMGLAIYGYSQNNRSDSLVQSLTSGIKDTNRVNTLHKLCDECRKNGDYKKGLEYAEEALQLSRELKFKKGIGISFNYLGLNYEGLGNYAKALNNFFTSLKIREELGDKKGISNAYNNIGIVYNKQNNYPKALENYSLSIQIKQELDDKKGMANSYNNIGTIYKDLGDNNKALEIFSISLKLFEETKNKKGISAAYNNIGNTYFNQQNYSKALENFEAALKIKEKIGDKNGMAISYTNIGNTLLKQNNITEAKKMQLLALEFSSEIGAKNIMADAYFALAICDSLTGNFKSAYAYYKLFKQYNDSLFNEESSRKTAQLSAQYESEKKDAEIALLNKDKEKQAVITEAENKKQIIIIWSGISGLLLVIVFSVYILNRWKLTRQQKAIIETQKHIVEEKQKEILDSIRYAKRIQQSLLPSEKYITRNLKQHN